MALTETSHCSDGDIDYMFASRYLQSSLPKFGLPEKSIPKEAAYQIISDELMLDSNPRLNLASFVTTWMEPECNKLIMETINKNYVDMDEYPVTTELQNRCVNIVARMFNAPISEKEQAVGVGTVGSSEAIMLAGLAFKRKWENKRKAQGKPYDNPNIVTRSNVQVCWEKFARYFEVELKEVKLKEGWDTPIHVDAASCGFIAPFIYPNLEWNFRLPLVRSINVSGHKYGLVYAGIGWVVWRGKQDLPEELIFHINYLGADQPTFTLNFSKGRFNMLSREEGVPLVAFFLKEKLKYSEHDISEHLRRFNWVVPANNMVPDAQHVSLLRVVIRENFSRSLADRLVQDISTVLNELDSLPVKRERKRGHVAAHSNVDSQGVLTRRKFKDLTAPRKTKAIC